MQKIEVTPHSQVDFSSPEQGVQEEKFTDGKKNKLDLDIET